MSDRPPPFDLSAIEEIEHVWIPARDGTRLAARLWLPACAREAPVPAILEYLPYRKRDFTRERDEPMHRYYALAGYACLRVDLRGTGDSEGVLKDEYSAVELQDALDILDWIAAQPWCDGAVGMTGISWGGFNALQVAALAPPQLKAVISLCASDDRFADDAHYKGGCLLNENMQWGSILTLYNALPPDPEIVGAPWRDMWRARIEALEPFPALWMEHPVRDAYWRHGSVCENFDAIRCPVYAIGGWADGYSNAVPRLLAGLSVPRKGLIGPWAHLYPHLGIPGPAIGYMQEAVRWWDHWLKGRDTGIMDEPMFRVWIQDWARPQPQYESRPGRWVAERAWPSPRIETLRLNLDRGFLSRDPAQTHEISFSSPQTVGVRAGEWCGFGADGEAPRDQRADDGGSLIFDSEPFRSPVDLLGAPVLDIDVASDQTVAFLVARLCDVAPDGTSLRISYGVLNLTHRDGHADPRPLPRGEWHRIRLQLDDLGHRVGAGHRLRLALSTDYWPMIWPAPAASVLTVRTGEATLDLPARPPPAEDEALPLFDAPTAAPGTSYRALRSLQLERRLEVDLTTNEMVYTLRSDGGFGGASLARLDEIDLELGYTLLRRFQIRESEPSSAATELQQTASLSREGWIVEIACRTKLSTTPDAFRFTGELDAREGGEPFASRNWDREIPRSLL